MKSLIELEQEIEKFTKNIDKSVAITNSYEDELKSLREDKKHLEEFAQGIKASNERLSNQLREIKASNIYLNNEIREIKASNECLNNELREIKASNERLNNALKVSNERLNNALKANQHANEGSFSNLKNELRTSKLLTFAFGIILTVLSILSLAL